VHREQWGSCCTSPGEKRLLLKHQQGVC